MHGPFLGLRPHRGFQRGARRDDATPPRARRTDVRIQRVDDRRVFGCLQDRQARARQRERREPVDPGELQPCVEIDRVDGRELLGVPGAMDDAVDAAERAGDGADGLVELPCRRGREIERDGRGLRAAVRFDLVVDLRETRVVAAEQDERRAAVGAGEGDGTSDAARGAGDEDDAPEEFVVGGGRGLRVHGFSRIARAQASPLRTAASSVAG